MDFFNALKSEAKRVADSFKRSAARKSDSNSLSWFTTAQVIDKSLEKKDYFKDKGQLEKLDVDPKKNLLESIQPSQLKDNALPQKFVSEGENEKLEFPKADVKSPLVKGVDAALVKALSVAASHVFLDKEEANKAKAKLEAADASESAAEGTVPGNWQVAEENGAFVVKRASKKVTSHEAPSKDAEEFISHKIKKIREEDPKMEPMQAEAIAYSMAREEGFHVPEKKSSLTILADTPNKDSVWPSGAPMAGGKEEAGKGYKDQGQKEKIEFPAAKPENPLIPGLYSKLDGQEEDSKFADSKRFKDSGIKEKINLNPGMKWAADEPAQRMVVEKGGFKDQGEKEKLMYRPKPQAFDAPSKVQYPQDHKLPDSFRDKGLASKPFQKQFSMNGISFKRKAIALPATIDSEAIKCASADLKAILAKYDGTKHGDFMKKILGALDLLSINLPR